MLDNETLQALAYKTIPRTLSYTFLEMPNDYILRSDVEKILKLQLELHESSYSELSPE